MVRHVGVWESGEGSPLLRPSPIARTTSLREVTSTPQRWDEYRHTGGACRASFKSWSRLEFSSTPRYEIPVMVPPGRARLRTMPIATGSDNPGNTIGMSRIGDQSPLARTPGGHLARVQDTSNPQLPRRR